MKQKLTSKQVSDLIKRYKSGETAKSLYEHFGISRTTFYNYVRSYNSKVSLSSSATTLHLANVKLGKLSEMIEIKNKVNCTIHSTTRTKLLELEKLHGQYSVHTLCEALKVDRATYYNHIKRNKREDSWFTHHRENLKPHILEVFYEFNQIYGSNKIHLVLKDRGIKTSPEYVSSIMKELGLKCIRTNAKRDYLRLSSYKVDKLKRNFTVDAPNTVWVSDTTYLKFDDQKLYLCVVMDLFSRKILSHKISNKHTSNLVSSSFKLACKTRDFSNLTFHSDQGSQYTSRDFRLLLHKLNVTQSFSPIASPLNNAVAESFFSWLKSEEYHRYRYRSISELKQRIGEYIIFYNDIRKHSFTSYLPPSVFEDNFHLNKTVRK